MSESFLIIGGDKRQDCLKNILLTEGYKVFHIRYPADVRELDSIGEYKNVVLPLPITKDKISVYSSNNELKISLEDIYSKLMPYQRVFGGGFNSYNSYNTFDLLNDSAFKLANAYLTAQSALRLLLENSNSYIIGKTALIIGFGDVARTLGDLLSKLGLMVIICARNKNQLLIATMMGYKTINLQDIDLHIGEADYIFGSIPATVIGKKQVNLINNKAVYFELASAPFTADKKSFEDYNKTCVFGTGLPGRYLPLASAELIADYILDHIEEGSDNSEKH